MTKRRIGPFARGWLLLSLALGGACSSTSGGDPGLPAGRSPQSTDPAASAGGTGALPSPSPIATAPAVDGPAPSAAGATPSTDSGGAAGAAVEAAAGEAGAGGAAATTAGACCSASMDSGCAASPRIEQCVCAKDPECCSAPWDAFCALLVTTETANGACGTCP